MNEREMQSLLALAAKRLHTTPEALRAVAAKALERRTGARGLRSIMEETLTPLMYETPSDHTIEKITITPDCVNGTGTPELVRDLNRQLPEPQTTAKKRARKISAS